MIIKAEIIDQPYSGEYKEKIYDITSTWNSQNWTWVKFLNEDFTEWCGEFRGLGRGIAISKKYNQVLILTSDYLFQINCINFEIIDYECQPQYQNLTVTPLGDFLLADYYDIYLLGASLDDRTPLASPFNMDMITFRGWSNNKLQLTCDKFLNLDKHVELQLDFETLEISLKKQNRNSEG
ncbi:hypothetical protein [Alkaliphilus hydrothermalis]|uniref:Uncharacterized protein n=1 Tax=Alkaliphilus hydrothermalis TaxID=1482730 RepID=A0ABS2NND6_9FIRM|nr:hypothetical protein [Alkaliphilus hydrothermalis]MBM7614342.1 hypothetical protein [Alkaliphilus hydrothermalis]